MVALARLRLFVLGLAVLGGNRIARAEPSEPSVEALVRQLGDGDYAQREAAGQRLIKLGLSAVPALRQAAAAHVNPEIRRRAQKLFEAVLWNNRKSPSTGLETVLLKPSSYHMGSPANEMNRQLDETRHQVWLSTHFMIGAYEVTQDEYQKVMEANPSWFSPTGDGKVKVVGLKTNRFPVETVTWFDALEFCNRLSKLDGFEPYYKLEEVKHEAGAISVAKVTIAGGHGYRLPTEAEWEYASRAESALAFHFGTTNTGKEANLRPNPGAGGYGAFANWTPLERTTTVGSYKPNRWDLFDMHGNVAEWCGDWYSKDYYANSPKVDPAGPAEGHHRVVRGGSWLVSESNGRTASRFWLAPGDRNYSIGFRVARTP